MQIREVCSTASTSITAAIIGAAAFVVGVSLDVSDLAGAIRQIGALVLVGVIVKSCIRPALKPQVETFEHAYQQGLDQGWTRGHRAARPVVVPMIRNSDGASLPAPPISADSEMFQDAHIASSS